MKKNSKLNKKKTETKMKSLLAEREAYKEKNALLENIIKEQEDNNLLRQETTAAQTEKLESLKNTVRQKDAKITELSGEIDEFIEDIIVIKEQNAALEALIKKKEELNRQLQESIQTQATQLRELQNALEKEQEEKKEKERTIAALNDEINTVVEDLKTVKEKNADLENTLQEKETANQKLQESIQTQEIQLWELQNALEKEQEEKKEKERTIVALNDEINTVVEDLKIVKEKNADLENTFQEKETANQKLQESIQTQATQLRELQNALEKEQEEKTAKEATITALNEEINTIVEDLASIKESKCWIYTKPIRDLQRAISGGKEIND